MAKYRWFIVSSEDGVTGTNEESMAKQGLKNGDVVIDGNDATWYHETIGDDFDDDYEDIEEAELEVDEAAGDDATDED